MKRMLALGSAALMLAALLVQAQPGAATAAVDPGLFKPGNIISDANFYNGNAMSESEIQTFLNAMIGSCNNSLCLNILTQNTYSRPADRTVCAAYSGADNEPVSRMIYKVQNACGISAKVLLVTLQKEMGLVTSKAPGQWSLDHAMGYACPDTAPCDSSRSGFYNQVYMAAWQFKRYSTPTPWGYYQPGWKSIQFHPNASCGSSSVYIENNATAALYNYTPYQPNSAAMANYPGIGDGCSSYGNRNFWFLYNNWFGSSADFNGAAQINDAYQISGGETGPLGPQISERDCEASATSCFVEYEHGIIGWTYTGGAHLVLNETFGKYGLSGGPSGPLGLPVGAEVPITGPNGNGFSQAFQGGQILRSAAGIFVLRTSMLNELAKYGWVRGSLGWPTADQVCKTSSSCSQEFQHGVIGSTSQSALYVVVGPTGEKYFASGGPSGPLGLPVGAEVPITGPNDDGFSQSFQGGQILRSAAGIFVLRTSMLNELAKYGWVRGSLGWPTADQECMSQGGCAQQFQHGAIGSITANVFYVVNGAAGAVYIASGGPSGPLGFPKGSEVPITSPTGNGFSQAFQGGQILRSASGAFVLRANMLAELAKYGWVRGSLGWPTANQTCDVSGCIQSFQTGKIVFPPSGPPYIINDGPIAEKYNASGGPSGPLGISTGLVTAIAGPNGDGFSQAFQGGQILQSAAGTFVLRSSMLTVLANYSWVRGPVGWPIADQVCDSIGCTQQFQYGTITIPKSGSPYVIDNGPIGSKYLASGGPSGPLGVPVGAVVEISGSNGDGYSQAFQSGQILRSASGTFILRTGFLIELAKYGWVRGSLGWPISDQVCDGDGCTQQFQHGQISISPAGTIVVV